MITRLSAATFLVSVFFTTGCTKSDELSNADIRLKGKTADITFSLPRKFEAIQGSLIRFTCAYPNMEPCRDGGIPNDDDITLFIEPSDGKGRTEWMMENALESFDPIRPGREYYSGTQGIYAVYRAIVGAGKETATEKVILVFRSRDGAMVGVEDPGRWSHNYTVWRKIGKNLQVKYLISKPIGRDFPEIDERVVNFINAKIS